MRMSPTLPLQQALISDPAVIKDLISEDGGSCVSAPGRLNGLLSQVVGQHSIILLAPTAHRQRRKLLTPPFHGERLKAYGHLIVSLAEQSMEDVLLGDVVDVRERMQAITMQVILTAVFGFDEGESFQQIATRRKALEQSSGQDWKVDILSLLLACTDEQGQGLSDDELHDELLTLLFAGHETTATALTWALYWIHRHPSVRQRLLDELKAMREPADPEAIAKLPYLSAVVNEVLRIHPVAMLMFPRRIESAISLGGLFRSWRCGAELHSGAALVLLWPSTS